MLRKQGVKIFADGTPWLGTIATSFPSLDTEPVRASGFPMGPHPAERALNYDRDEFDRLLGPAAAAGLQVACPVNGDLAIDFVLDAYEVTLERHDLLDGQMYSTEHGANWCRIGDAGRLGLRQSCHNDGSISRPLPLANVQAAVTRRVNRRHLDGTYSWSDGSVHGPDQRVSLDEALRGITINAAYTVHRDDEIGTEHHHRARAGALGCHHR